MRLLLRLLLIIILVCLSNFADFMPSEIDRGLLVDELSPDLL